MTDRTSIPISVATDAVSVFGDHLRPAVLASIPAAVPVAWGTPVLAD